MKRNTLKIFLAGAIALPLLGIAVFSTNSESSSFKNDDNAETVYKTKCAMCHKKDASRFFDPAKEDEHHVNAIMKGQKGEKPPNMPAFEQKGITEEQAQELVDYMRSLLPADDTNANSNTKESI